MEKSPHRKEVVRPPKKEVVRALPPAELFFGQPLAHRTELCQKLFRLPDTRPQEIFSLDAANVRQSDNDALGIQIAHMLTKILRCPELRAEVADLYLDRLALSATFESPVAWVSSPYLKQRGAHSRKYQLHPYTRALILYG